MNLTELLKPDLCVVGIPGTEKEEALRNLISHVSRSNNSLNEDAILNAVMEREALGTTALGRGVAFPHAKLDGFGSMVVAVASSAEGIRFGARDGKPVQLVVLLVTGPTAPDSYLKTLGAFARISRDSDRMERLISAPSPEELYKVISSYEEVTGEWLSGENNNNSTSPIQK